MFILLSVCLVLSLLASASARAGVDLSVRTSAADWSCIRSNNVDYAIIRAFRNAGVVDTNATASLAFAAGSGISDLGAYIFPCVQTSALSVSKNITCPSPTEQVQLTLQSLREGGIAIAGDRLPGPLAPKATINRIWLDIEDEQPPKYFDANPTVNQKLLEDMVSALERRGVAVGIYTTKTYWQNIMNNILGYSKYPLWYSRYDGVDSMDFFNAFAGWESVLIKQTAGDSGLCGITQIDPDYMLDA